MYAAAPEGAKQAGEQTQERPARRLGWMNRDRIEVNWKQLAGNGWWWETLEAPVPQPGKPDREAEHRWENEGGNPPMAEPPDAKPRKHL